MTNKPTKKPAVIESISLELEHIAADICNNYCKYPDQWDAEKGMRGALRVSHLPELPAEPAVKEG